ncbi:segmentation protein cap'n'collar [Episyrphus balteatus]|uniref:segmentation protein cap'n'collar n=1 Tax=Episyrphus balteatus TaxID=286459 RepID=UPI002485B8E0|nr:segmentation protein cap'n'collar [Episyrphus balteatus]XP_055852205.1 segmentation protein cap'n'collar [Episyrphus balteatus]
MHPRSQNVAELFTPVPGFYGVSAETPPYTYYYPNHSQKNHSSNLCCGAKLNQQQNYIHRGDSNFPASLTTSVESTPPLGLSSLYAHAGSHCVPNVTNASTELVQNEVYLNAFFNEECIGMIDINGIERSAIYHQDGITTIDSSNSGTLQVHDKPEYTSSAVYINSETDRLDASCDSAVSSLSSEKVPSTSDGDWGDESDSGHDTSRRNFNGPYDYSSNTRSFISRQTSFQKKYHMFGKRCLQEEATKNTIVYSKLQISNSQRTIRDCSGIENSAFLDFEEDILPNPNSGNPGFVRECNKFQSDGHLTRDEKRARNLHVPIPVPDIINLPMDEFNERISKYDLNENQLSLIRDIRRRGKNKVAAQNCRKRKLDTILFLEGEVQEVRRRKDKLLNERSLIVTEKKRIANKFAALHNFIFQFLRDAEGNPCSPSNFSLQQQSDGSMYLLPRESSKQ